MPDKTKDKEYRGVEYRLFPGSRAKARKLSGLAGACRFVWNHFLARNKEDHDQAKESGGKKPSVSFSLQESRQDEATRQVARASRL